MRWPLMGSLGPKQIKRDPMPSNQRVCCHGPIGRYTWRVVLGLCFLSALLIAFRYWSIHDAQGSLFELSANGKPVWLIGTMSAPADFERRALIRSTWQTLYNDPRYTFRFVLGKVDAAHAIAIAGEQADYNDLLILSSLEDNPHTAKSIKPLEFLQHITLSAEYYDFVSTVDDDSFLNIPDFAKEYLAPRLRKNTAEPCLIGRPLIAQNHVTGQNFMYPDCQFYTLSWDLVEVIARQYSLAPIKDAGDEALGRLLDRSQEPYSFVSLSNRQVFNYDPRRDDPHAWSHKVCKDAINPGGMKLDRTFLEVAKFFDKDGLTPEGKHC